MLLSKNYQEFQILSESGTVVSTFEGKQAANRCLPGDFVVETSTGLQLLQRNQKTPLVGTVHIQSKYLFGHTSRNVPIYLFYPYNTSYPPFRVGCSSKEGINKIGLVLFESWDQGETYPRGILQQILGDSGDPVAEELALKYNYAPEWKKLGKIPEEPLPVSDYEFVKGFTFNIDPPGCKDIDDCLSIERIGTNIRFSITIANLINVVKPDSELDRLAQTQVSTLYSTEGEAIAPMLPRWISEQKASLHPGQTTNGLTLSMIWDGKTLCDFRFFESSITNQQSYTYDSVYENKEICEVLTAIASYLEGAPCTDSHKWVEHAMVLYNKEVARLFLEHSTGLLRRLDSVSTKRLEQKAAEYCLPTQGATHVAMENSHYTHATSPIRRYADILAQRFLCALLQGSSAGTPSPLLLQRLNNGMKQAARFERDLCFLRILSQSSTGTVEGTILDWKESSKGWKVWVEIPLWNQIIRFTMKGKEDQENLVLVAPDEQDEYRIQREKPIHLNYYCDRAQPNWKTRMVFGIQKKKLLD